jgi:hypothetical protein
MSALMLRELAAAHEWARASVRGMMLDSKIIGIEEPE